MIGYSETLGAPTQLWGGTSEAALDLNGQGGSLIRQFLDASIG
jgi:hypothetical protein